MAGSPCTDLDLETTFPEISRRASARATKGPAITSSTANSAPATAEGVVFSHPTSESPGRTQPASSDRPKPSRHALFREPDNGQHDRTAETA